MIFFITKITTKDLENNSGCYLLQREVEYKIGRTQNIVSRAKQQLDTYCIKSTNNIKLIEL